MPKVAIVSLGCAKNTVDSENLVGLLAKSGCQLTVDLAEAGIVLVNTCGFIESARKESVETLLDLALNPIGKTRPLVIAVGCLAERYGKELLKEMPELAAVVGPGFWDRMPEVLKQVLQGERPLLIGAPPLLAEEGWERTVSTPRSYCYLKISDGCDNRCSYCAIPTIRGPLRSKPTATVVAEARALIAQGFKELVVIAQDTTRYGYDLGLGNGLASLLKTLSLLEGDFKIRLMYAHPEHVTEELIDLYASSDKLLPYLDLPIQHAHPDILRSMGRNYSVEQVLYILQRLRRVRPDIAIRSTVLLGYPGENENQFRFLQHFLKDAGFSHLGAFIYSAEEGTRAERLRGKVLPATAQRRRDQVMSTHQSRSRRWLRSFRGSALPVTVDGVSDQSEHLLQGRTEWQAPEVDGVTLITAGSAIPGQRVMVRVTRSLDYDLVGEIVEEN